MHLRRWIAPVLWMLVIFFGSTARFSAEATGAVVIPLLRILLPWADLAHLQLLHAALRKAGHLFEYAILACLWFRSLSSGRRFLSLPDERQGREEGGATPPEPLPGRSGRTALAAFAISLAYAALDELHQAATGVRTGRVLDVLWDGAGAAGALGILRFAWQAGATFCITVVAWIAAAATALLLLLHLLSG